MFLGFKVSHTDKWFQLQVRFGFHVFMTNGICPVHFHNQDFGCFKVEEREQSREENCFLKEGQTWVELSIV